VSCGGGQRNRVRTVKQSAMGGGIPCVDALLETSGCSLAWGILGILVIFDQTCGQHASLMIVIIH